MYREREGERERYIHIHMLFRAQDAHLLHFYVYCLKDTNNKT